MGELRLPDPPLRDDVVRLRPWCEEDVEHAHRAIQDPLISRFTRVPAGETVEQLREFVAGHAAARIAGDGLELAITGAETDVFLGAIGLLRLEWSERRGEIGYYLAPEARGRGVATRAVRLLSRWALTQAGLARLALQADTDNHASQRVAERCGFTREGVLRSVEERNGQRHDLVMFSLLAAELTSRVE